MVQRRQGTARPNRNQRADRRSGSRIASHLQSQAGGSRKVPLLGKQFSWGRNRAVQFSCNRWVSEAWTVRSSKSKYRHGKLWLNEFISFQNSEFPVLLIFVSLRGEFNWRFITDYDVSVAASLSVHIHPQKLTVDVDKEAIFICTHGGFPVVRISWFHNGKALFQDGRRSFRSTPERLVIKPVQKEDHGMYQCFINNEWDMAQSTAELQLGGKFAIAARLT